MPVYRPYNGCQARRAAAIDAAEEADRRSGGI